MMKRMKLSALALILSCSILFVIGMLSDSCTGQTDSEEFASVKEKVRKVLDRKEEFRKQKEEKVFLLESFLREHKDSMSAEEQFVLVKKLYDEFRLYSFDRAYDCAVRLYRIAQKLPASSSRLIEAQVCIGYVLARGGFFKEAIDSLSVIKIEEAILPDSVLADYYIRFGRTYHDLADYTNDSIFSPYYNELGNKLLKMGLCYVSDSLNLHYIQGKIALKSGNVNEAREHYLQALKYCPSRDKEWHSILYSTMAFIDHQLDMDNEAINYYVKAVENDVEGSIMESVALRGLANLLFYHKKDFNTASEFINIALNDAMFYGTRHRMNVIGTLLPVFVGKKLDTVETKMQTFFRSFLGSLMLITLLVIAVGNAFWQMKKIRSSKKALLDMNLKLKEANRVLREVSQIKDCYLGHYLDLYFELVNQLESFCIVAQQKIGQKNIASVQVLIRNLVKQHNRKEMFIDFDCTFLSLFPSFVVEFNSLLLPEEQITLESENTLNPTLRIYALFRLGISDTNQIAKILNYSFNTVYNYRIRIRNKAKDPKTFEEQVLKIAL